MHSFSELNNTQLFIHSTVDGHLGYFHVLAIVNSAAMNTEIHVSFWNLLYDAGNPKLVLCDNLEGWNGEGGGREGTYAFLWPIQVNVWQKPSQYCKDITF